MHFEIAIAASGIIAPKLYIHLRKAQDEQRSDKAILLTEMSYGYSSGLTTAYESLSRDELGLGSYGPSPMEMEAQSEPRALS